MPLVREGWAKNAVGDGLVGCLGRMGVSVMLPKNNLDNQRHVHAYEL